MPKRPYFTQKQFQYCFNTMRSKENYFIGIYEHIRFSAQKVTHSMKLTENSVKNLNV